MPSPLTAFEKAALQLLAQILGVASDLGTAQQLDNLMRITSNNFVQLANLTYGLEAQYAQHVEMLNDLTSMTMTLNALLSDYQQRGQPVTLPSPPAGYGGATTSAIALDVWTYGLPGGSNTGDALNDVYASAQALGGNTFVTIPGYPWMAAQTLDNWQNLADQALGPPAVLDAGTILPSDASILAWANRAHHGPAGWTNVSLFGHTTPRQIDDNTANVRWWITMTPAEFAAFQAVPVVVRTAPVWPGLAGKTWGTPVALADQLTITAAMDGIAIAIDSTPARLSFWQFDDLRSYRNLGAISFFTDNGDQEAAQTMGFDEAIYTPKTMVRAGGVKIRLTGGVTGTIYPWTITP